jgi:hypothetical protein
VVQRQAAEGEWGSCGKRNSDADSCSFSFVIPERNRASWGAFLRGPEGEAFAGRPYNKPRQTRNKIAPIPLDHDDWTNPRIDLTTNLKFAS